MLDSPLGETKLWKPNDYEELLRSLGDLQNESDPLIAGELEHKLIIKEVAYKGSDGRVGRVIRFCQRCKVSWPCLVAQENAIRRGEQRRQA